VCVGVERERERERERESNLKNNLIRVLIEDISHNNDDIVFFDSLRIMQWNSVKFVLPRVIQTLRRL